MTLSEDLPHFLLQMRIKKHKLPVTLAVLQIKPVPPTRYRISHFQHTLTTTSKHHISTHALKHSRPIQSWRGYDVPSLEYLCLNEME